MGNNDEVCNTKLALGIGSSSGNSLLSKEKLNHDVLSLNLSFGLGASSSRAAGESSRNNSSSNDDDGVNNNGGSRKKLRLSKEQSSVLEDKFKEHSSLSTAQKNDLAEILDLKPRQVEVWFQNRRARTKLKQTEIDCEQWKKNCGNLTEENNRLKKEIEEIRALEIKEKAALLAQLKNGVAAVTVCSSCWTIKSGKESSREAAASSMDVVLKPKHKHSGLKIHG